MVNPLPNPYLADTPLITVSPEKKASPLKAKVVPAVTPLKPQPVSTLPNTTPIAAKQDTLMKSFTPGMSPKSTKITPALVSFSKPSINQIDKSASFAIQQPHLPPKTPILISEPKKAPVVPIESPMRKELVKPTSKVPLEIPSSTSNL